MSIISDADPDSAPSVLIVDNNQMAMLRMKEIFRHREFHVIECTDGDKAVDEYIRNDPELVVMSLDIPSLDGHLAALEMREHDSDCRLMFIAPRHLRQLAIDASHSAGAVGWVEKPVTNSVLDEIWDDILGDIPAAPGLEDLDQLYPGEILATDVEEEPLPPLLPLPLPQPIIPDIGDSDVNDASEIEVSVSKVKKTPKGKKGKRLLILILFSVIGLIGAEYLGHIDLTTLL